MSKIALTAQDRPSCYSSNVFVLNFTERRKIVSRLRPSQS